MFIDIQDVRCIDGTEISIVPSVHYVKRVKERGICSDNVFNIIRRFIDDIYINTSLKDICVIYDSDLNSSFGIQVYKYEIILTTAVNDKMEAAKNQKIFKIKEEKLESIPYSEYIEN